MLRIEFGLVLLALLIAFIYPSLGSRWFEKLERCFSKLSRRRVLSIVFVGVLALALRAAVLPIEPIPEPIVHDEFGYLLAADTFAHGRLTNPTHPMWKHFESFSILQKPTYQCFAQPAQGMILAFGKVVFGHPFWGVWLSIGLMCASITWMLQGWLSPEWALLGGVLAILRYGVFGYWANSYWGGAAGAIGGALVLGALPRIKSSQRIRDALLMGVGLAILANSRPYEGFVFSLPVAFLLFVWLFGKNRPSFSISLRRVLLPLTLMLALTAAGLGYYLYRVTGTPFKMPYQIERETYAVVPYMIWQPVRLKPIYHHAVMEKMYADQDLSHYKLFLSPVGFLVKGIVGWDFYLGPAFTLPLLMLAFSLPRNFSLRKIDPATLAMIFVLGGLVVGSALETYYNPHYSAPATGLVLALLLLATRQLRDWTRAGVFLSRALPVICALTLAMRAAAAPLQIPLHEFYEFGWHQKGPENFGRENIQSELQRVPGDHLVIVHYQPEHEPFDEWVYNDADIDNSKVVWAREMDPSENTKLIQYFGTRKAWLLDADRTPPILIPYRPPLADSIDRTQGPTRPPDNMRLATRH
jgi:hypothetical protein